MEQTPRPLFVYGSLRAKPLLAWFLTGDRSRVDDLDGMITPAQLPNHTSLAVKDSKSPTAVRSSNEGDCINGYLVQVDTMFQRRTLGDKGFALETTTVMTTGNDGRPTGEIVEADFYNWAGDKDMITTELWDLEKFIEEDLDCFFFFLRNWRHWLEETKVIWSSNRGA